MHRPTIAVRPVLAALVAAILLAGCFGDEAGSPASTSRPVATETVPFTPTPAPPTQPPLEAEGSAFIYSTQVSFITEGTRIWPTRAVRAFDRTAGIIETLFEYGGVGEYPVREVARGAVLFYATETRLAAVEPDAADPREVFSITGDMKIQDFDVSPDGSTIVLTVGWVAAGEFRSRLFFLDSQTGAELNRLDDTDPALETFMGSLYSVLWPAEGDAVIVAGVTRTDYPGSLATVTVEGEITVSAGIGLKVTSPDGGLATSGRPAACTAGPSAMSSELDVADLTSGQVVLHVAEPETGYYAYAWSPDGTELLYREQPYDASGACFPTGPWRLLYADGTSELADLKAVLTRWFGDELVELVCDEPDDRFPDAVLLNRDLQVRKACGSGPEPEGELRLNGMPVERLFEVRVLGFR